MSDLAVSFTFSANTTIASAQANTNFSDIVNYINNRDDGTSTWDNMNVTATVANPVTIKSNASNTEVAIDNTASDGDPILTFKLSGTQLYVVGVDDSDSDFLKFATTGITTGVAMQIPSGGSQVQFAAGSAGTPSLSFIGDTNTGFYSVAADNIGIVCGGSRVVDVTANVFNPVGAGSITLGDSTNYWQRVFVGNGTEASPGMRFGSEATGFYIAAAGNIAISFAGTRKFDLTATLFNPVGGGVISTGDASNYWNDISYKTLTDRGCLGWFDEGVELQDGRKVSDTEAILAIEKDDKKETVYGVPMLKYSTFPKVAYKRVDGLDRDENDNPIGGSDGVEMTSMFSIMIGAIKELTNRVKVLEAK